MKLENNNMEKMKLSHSLGPIAILEGGSGLNDTEEFIKQSCDYENIRTWVIDELYDKPARLAAIQFLKPKTIILGTTGVYKDKLDMLIDLFFSLKIEGLEYVIITIGEDVLYKHFEKLKNVKILEPTETYSIFDNVGETSVFFEPIEE